MKVAFNGTAMLPSLTGIGRYAREIALGLQASTEVEAEFMFGVSWSRSVPTMALPGASRLFPWVRDHLPAAYTPRRWAQTASLALRQSRRRFDLYHEPAVLALPYRGPVVLTVHDISWLRFPETQPAARVRMLHRWFEPGLARAGVVLTPSNFVRHELIEAFALPPHRVVTTPLAADPDYRPHSAVQTAALLQRLGLQHGRYLLAVGTLEPRKNLSATLQAFLQLAPALRRRYPLVVVGMQGWNASQLQQRLDPLVRSGEVRRLGYLPHAELVTIMAGARALAFPSLYEGFGLPPLEAMACGVPSVVADVASLPEVVGDAGLQVAPHDIDGLAAAMRCLLEDDPTHARLSRAGLRQAALFSWQRCVAQTLDAYRQVLASGPLQS